MNTPRYPRHRYFDVYLESSEMHEILRAIWTEASKGKKHSSQELCVRITEAIHSDLQEYPTRWNSLEPAHLSVIGSFAAIVENRLQLHVPDSSFVEFRADCVKLFKDWPEPQSIAIEKVSRGKHKPGRPKDPDVTHRREVLRKTAIRSAADLNITAKFTSMCAEFDRAHVKLYGADFDWLAYMRNPKHDSNDARIKMMLQQDIKFLSRSDTPKRQSRPKRYN
jgi:hypothetical protein